MFRIPRQLLGYGFPDRLCFEIRQLPAVTCADLALVCEAYCLDSGLMNVMQKKVASQIVRGWITGHEIACISEFVGKCDAIKGSNYVERIKAIFEKLQAIAAVRKGLTFRLVCGGSHSWSAEWRWIVSGGVYSSQEHGRWYHWKGSRHPHRARRPRSRRTNQICSGQRA